MCRCMEYVGTNWRGRVKMPHVYDPANVGTSDASGDGTLKPGVIAKYLFRCSKYLVPSLDLHLGWKRLKAANADGCLS